MIGQIPDIAVDSEDCSRSILAALLGREDCELPSGEQIDDRLDRQMSAIRSAPSESSAVVVDPKDVLCDGGSCDARMLVRIYEDATHLSTIGAGRFAEHMGR